MSFVSRPLSAAGLLLALLPAACGKPAPVRTAVVRALPAGTTPEFSIAEGETHAYLLDLAAGTFADLAVDQRGVDVEVSVKDPDGRPLATPDSNFGAWGTEPVPVVAERPGRYRVEIRPSGARVLPGRYVIRLAALRPATPRDHRRVAAEGLFARSEELRRRGGTASLQAAVAAGLQALAGFRALREQGREADVLYSLAYASIDLERAEDALAFDGQALALFRALHREREEGRTLNDLGQVFRSRGEPGKALSRYREALLLNQRLGERWAQAVSLQGLGMVYRSLGETGQAIDHYERALKIWRGLGDRVGEARTRAALGNFYQFVGDQQQALDHLEPALAIFASESRPRDEASTLTSIGDALSRKGEGRRAVETLERALAIERRTGDRGGEATTLNDLGWVYILLGDWHHVRECFVQARALYRESGDRPDEAVALANVAWADARAGRAREAVAEFDEALPLLAAFSDRTTEAGALLGLAQARLSLGDSGGARTAVEAGIERVESLRGTSASHQIRAAFQARNQEFYAFEVDLLMAMHRAGEALEASERARARGLLDLLAESGADLRRGVDPALLARADEADRRINEADLQRSRLRSAGTDAGRRAVAERALRQALADADRAQTELRLASPAYAALTRPHPLSVPEIQRQILDADTLLLEYHLGAERSFVWAVTADGVTAFALPPRKGIEEMARRAYRSLSSRQTTRERVPVKMALDELSRCLLGPVAGLLNRKRLLVVPDGALHYLPFAALPVPGSAELLVAGHEVVTSPSASALAVERRELAGRRPASKALAVVADPVFDLSDPRMARRPLTPPAAPRGEEGRLERLPYSRAEAEALLDLAPPEERLSALGFDASRETVLSGTLARYRIVHFATHGVLDPANPGLSRLVLSQVDERGRPRDGSVRTHELYGLSLPAELVVLSACRTALGQEIRGEGLVGLTRGFQYAGARAVLVSLWEVDDQATAELMRLFYREVLRRGQPPAAALRIAQEALRQQARWQPPYFWAGFTLQGDWQAGSTSLNQSAPPGSIHGKPEPRGFSRRTP